MRGARFAAGAAILLFAATGMARADAGDPLVLGQENTATAVTTIDFTATQEGEPAFVINRSYDGPDGPALKVLGGGANGDEGANTAIVAVGALTGAEITGQKIGVDAAGDLHGVRARSSGTGVTAMGWEGVWAKGDGVGVHAESDRVALEVQGPAVFSRSGVVTLTSPAKSVVISGVPVTDQSMVLATAQSQAGVWVMAAVPHKKTGDGFTIYLNKPLPAGKSIVVAWFVLG